MTLFHLTYKHIKEGRSRLEINLSAQKLTMKLWIPVCTGSVHVHYNWNCPEWCRWRIRNRRTTWSGLLSVVVFEMAHLCQLRFIFVMTVCHVSYTTFMFILTHGYSELDHLDHHAWKTKLNIHLCNQEGRECLPCTFLSRWCHWTIHCSSPYLS